MTNAAKEHWNRVYSENDIRELGWYEKIPVPSIKLLNKCHLNKDDAILDAGAGVASVVGFLLDNGYTNINVADISEIALEKLKKRLGTEKSSLIKWIADDFTQPEHIDKLNNIALWYDRAVLHFLTEQSQRKTYFATLKKIVQKGGYVIIAAFAVGGAKKCSGLEVRNYDKNMLSEELGNDFELIDAFDYIYHNPSGDPRPYIYTLFQRKL